MYVCIIFCSYGGSMEASHIKSSDAAIVCFSLKPTGGPLPWPDAGGDGHPILLSIDKLHGSWILWFLVIVIINRSSYWYNWWIKHPIIKKIRICSCNLWYIWANCENRQIILQRHAVRVHGRFAAFHGCPIGMNLAWHGTSNTSHQQFICHSMMPSWKHMFLLGEPQE